MKEKNRKSIESCLKLPQFTTMNVIDGQAGLVLYSSFIFDSLTINNILNIIVLIILAGVGINLTLGENGILRRAEDAQRLANEATVKEKVETAVLQVQIEEVTNSGRLTHQKLYETLESKDSNITLNQYSEGDEQLTGTYNLNGEIYSFIIDSEFNVIIGEVEVEEPKPLSFGEITWTGGKASLTITSEISDDIEYQVNGTADGNWTQGNTVTNLEHEDIVYARINDGTTITQIQQKEIKDETDPEEFEITTSELTYEAIKLSTTGTTDNQTGLATYSYVAATSSSEIVKEITNQTVTEYPIEGLSPETEYVVYMLAYDNAGNVRKSNEVTVTTPAMPVGKLFGQGVNYIDLDGDETTPDWQIFYKEDGELNPAYKGATYIIPKYYVPASKMTTSLSNAGMSLYSGTYRVKWASAPGYKTILDGTDNTKPNVKSIFMYDYTGTSNDNVKAVSRLLDVDAWKDDFVTPQLQAKGGMAIGGPTINMWCASWNKAYLTEKVNPTISGTGYQVNGSDNLSLSSYTGYKTDAPNVYFPTKSNDSDGTYGYWLASPSSDISRSLMNVYYNGYVRYNYYNNNYLGVRPLVYLPSSVQLIPTETPNVWDINYGN